MPPYLYIVIASAIVIITILLAVALFYTIFILRDITKMVDDIEQIVDELKESVLKPIRLTAQIVHRIYSIVDVFGKHKK